MPLQPGTFREFAGRAAALLIVTYVLAVGGPLNGIVTPGIRRFSLALLTAGVLGWLIVVWRRPRDRALHPAVWGIVALWGVAYANSVLHNDSTRTWTGAWFGALYAGVWLVLLDLRGRGMTGRWIINGALVALVPVMLLAIIQVAPWLAAWTALDSVEVAFVPPRPPGTLGNPNALGSVLAGLLPFGLIRAGWGARPADRTFAALWCALAAVVLLLTYSRGAWLAAGTGAGALGLALAWRGDALARLRDGRLAPYIRVVAGLVMIALIGAGVLLWTSDAFDTPRRETADRLEYYRIAWRAFRAHPWTGTGPFTFGLAQAEERSIPPEQPHAHAHNLYLNVAAEFGIPGLVALAATAGLLMWRAVRVPGQQRVQGAAGIASLVAFGVHGLFDMPMIVPAVMLLYLALWTSVFELYAPRPVPRRQRAVVLLGLAGAWGIVLGAGWWALSTYETYVAGERLLVLGHYDEAIRRLERATDREPDNPLYWAEYGYACGLAAANGDEAYLQPGIRAYERALALERPHAVWWTNLAALQWQIGDREASVESMRAAVAYAPAMPEVWVNLGRYAELLGHRDDAEQAFERALAVDPRWGAASFWDETALRNRVRLQHVTEPLPYTEAQRHLQAGDLRAGVRGLERTIGRDPSQPGAYSLIAWLYVQAGEGEAARDYLAAARVLAHTDLDWAWIDAVAAELARAEGDETAWADKRSDARARLWPDDTGHPLYYGQDVANLQFLSLKVKGALLPQVVVLGPDPLLVALLRAGP
jgi:tetratricopeptide (TPR) repeat protein